MFSKYFSLFIRTPFSVSGSPLPLCMKNVASHISKLRMLWPSSHQPLQPEGSQDGKEENTFLAIEVHIKGMISMSPDSCIFTEKNAEFIHVRCLVFFNSNLLKFQTTWPLMQNFYISWLLPYLLGTVSLSREVFSWAWRLQKVCWIRHNSQFLGAFFFSWHPPGVGFISYVKEILKLTWLWIFIFLAELFIY